MAAEAAEEELIRLLKFGSARMIRDFVSSNPSLDLHYPGGQHSTPMSAAIERSSPGTLATLLDKAGCELDATLSYPCARTALMHAARSAADPEVVQLLIRKGADPRKVDVNGWNSLFYAVIGKRLGNVGALLDAQVSLESRDCEGRSPLMISVYLSNLETFKYLLDRGAELHALDNNGLSALQIAILRKKRDCVIELKRRGADTGLLAPFSKVSMQELIEELMWDVLPVRKRATDEDGVS